MLRYVKFTEQVKLNENLAGAKKIVKDTYILNKAVKEVSKNKIKTDQTGIFLLNSDDVAVKFDNVPGQIQDEAKHKFREIKLTEDDNRNIDRNPQLAKIRELLKDKLGYAQLFTYLYIKEMVPMEELTAILAGLNQYNDLLSKLRRPIANYIDVNIPNNAENLVDDLEELKRYRKLKKFIDEFTSDLKRDYQVCPPFFKDQLVNIAAAFDEIGKDDSTGKINTEVQRYTQKRFFDKIRRYKTVRELCAAAELFLKSEANAGIRKFYQSIENCNKKFGKNGVEVLYDEGGLMIMEVKSFASCKELFSNTSWCIASSLHQWDGYVGGENQFNKQYSILNFNLSPSDNNSIIGITIEPKQKVRACHAKNDAGLMGSGSSNFRTIFNKFEKDLGLEKDFIWDGLKPMTDAEISEKKRRIVANRELIKPKISLAAIRKFIVEDGGDVNASSGQALHNAVEEDDIEKIKFLLDQGASANLRSRQDATVNKVKSFDVLKLLIKKGAELTPQVFKPLINDPIAVKFCLDNGLSPNFEDNMPMRLAIKSGQLDVIKLLEEYNVSSDNRRQMNTKHAAEHEQWEIFDYFISKGGSYTEGIDKVMSWIGHSLKFSSLENKVKGLFRLQKYVDDGKASFNEEGYSVEGRGSKSSLKDVITKYGSVANYMIQTTPALKDTYEKMKKNKSI